MRTVYNVGRDTVETITSKVLSGVHLSGQPTAAELVLRSAAGDRVRLTVDGDKIKFWCYADGDWQWIGEFAYVPVP